jgi:hypothetical protein
VVRFWRFEEWDHGDARVMAQSPEEWPMQADYAMDTAGYFFADRRYF